MSGNRIFVVNLAQQMSTRPAKQGHELWLGEIVTHLEVENPSPLQSTFSVTTQLHGPTIVAIRWASVGRHGPVTQIRHLSVVFPQRYFQLGDLSSVVESQDRE